MIPVDWRTSNLTQIFKKGANAKAESYKPVYLTSKMFDVWIYYQGPSKKYSSGQSPHLKILSMVFSAIDLLP